jgi:hypothetical protein
MQKKYISFMDFLDWCETIDGKRWKHKTLKTIRGNNE